MHGWHAVCWPKAAAPLAGSLAWLVVVERAMTCMVCLAVDYSHISRQKTGLFARPDLAMLNTEQIRNSVFCSRCAACYLVLDLAFALTSLKCCISDASPGVFQHLSAFLGRP